MILSHYAHYRLLEMKLPRLISKILPSPPAVQYTSSASSDMIVVEIDREQFFKQALAMHSVGMDHFGYC